jgi:hypothetical protein
MAEDLVPAELGALKEQLSLIGSGLTDLCEELCIAPESAKPSKAADG